ncbi:serine hydrolase domain-containing protein [uncultured Croceitalea sp.]|uniref:serine hydrolase domain-containing protein n=1 Tax=uncultured Croceitalea sp. TaxID=1798908 RepID=UPI0033063188
MKKMLTVVIGILGAIVLFSWVWNPQLFKIAWYQKPQVDTYQHFPLRVVKASTEPFNFSNDKSKGHTLDSLLVKNWEGTEVRFDDYFKKGDLLAFLVIRNDTLIYERYGQDYKKMKISNTFSIGKSMISILVGKAIDQGLIRNTNQKIIEFLPEFKHIEGFDKLTIHDLLNMKSGLKFKRVGDGIISDLFSDEAKFYYTNNLKRDLLNVKMDTIPGTGWKYSNLDPLLLTWLLEKATGQKVSEYFEKEIWKPIGAEYDASWGIDREDGLENSPSSFQCTAIDLAKIGRLFLHNGEKDSLKILPSDWIYRSTRISKDNRINTSKGLQKATHQYYWWLPQTGFEGDYSAEGLRGQRLYVNPNEKIVIVQFANRGYGGYPYRTISNHFATKPLSLKTPMDSIQNHGTRSN